MAEAHMIPLATATFYGTRPIVDDLAELPTGTNPILPFRGHLSSLSQYRLRPGVEGAEMVLLHDPDTTLQNGDLIIDGDGDEWVVLSWNHRVGLGLDHGVAAVRRQVGHDG